MIRFSCPYLGGEVDLSDERERHISQHHPELLPAYREELVRTLADPDTVRRSARFGNAKLLSRWFETIRGGKHVVVVVVMDQARQNRRWIVTAYLARRLAEGGVEWKRS